MKIEKSDLNLKSILTNRPYLIWSILSGIVLILIVFVGLIPQAQQIMDLRDEMQLAERQLSTLRTKASDLENIEARQAYQTKDSVNQILPSYKPLLELLAGLNSVALQNRVSFTDFSLSPGEISSASASFLNTVAADIRQRSKSGRTASQGYESMPVELEIEGQFQDVQQFFLDVEKSAPLMTITSLSLNIKGEEMIKPTDKVQAELVLQNYYYTQSVSAALEKPLPLVGAAEERVIQEIENYSYPSASVQEQIISGGFEDIFGLSRADVELSPTEE